MFEHVVGQSHITTTLKNAIKNKHLAQAFLFCGPRGVGKTTCARILAKTINCQQVTDRTEPCNRCVSCASFSNNQSLSIYELDAASNNSVEDIRALVEQVRYPPQVGRYKVYIIDEVHMLSHAAFNAFLKTLEEPPSYAVFILATTEKQKIIPTILSRCQIFNFHRIQSQSIVQQLKHVAQQEGLIYEEEALFSISQKADGSLRDALSLFDLIATFSSGKSITLKIAQEHLHILDHTHYSRIVDACLQGNPGVALLIYDEILRQGFDGQHFISGLSEHLRNLMISRNVTSLRLLAVADSVKKEYQDQAARIDMLFLFEALDTANQCDLNYRHSHNKRLHVELALIELANINRRITHSASSLDTLPSPTEAILTPDKTAIQEHTKVETDVVSSSTAASQLPDGIQVGQPTLKLPRIDQLMQHLNQSAVAPRSQSLQTTTSVGKVTPLLPLTQEEVNSCLQRYAQELKKVGKMSEYSLLNQDIALDGNTIVISLINSVQQDILLSMQENMLAHLKTSLQRTNLCVKGMIIPQTQETHRPYTAREKFNYLLQQYPAVRLLQDKLGLEVQD